MDFKQRQRKRKYVPPNYNNIKFNPKYLKYVNLLLFILSIGLYKLFYYFYPSKEEENVKILPNEDTYTIEDVQWIQNQTQKTLNQFQNYNLQKFKQDYKSNLQESSYSFQLSKIVSYFSSK